MSFGTPKKSGLKYKQVRDAVGMTPRQQVDARRAMLLGIEIKEKMGELVKASEVEAERRECANVLQSDLFGALPSRCVTELFGKKLSAEQMRQKIIGVVREIVGGWTNAKIIP